ncbi:iron-siderophore ABC transporter substrate-binding protein [Burkholderia sp. S171]|uniref:iron-siderophore ABC transporter substrate-binding protein n=1 Tax=Burkholderia sp. S171 TaxID=1641860 RepID=UPI00131E87D2|nr:iron-siderophore ABC transporter substrate-binding protein [Burkholderia sp. S171]
MNRRAMLSALLGAGALAATALPDVALAGDALVATPRRIVVLDWGLTEMVLSIGVVPVGIANTRDFRRNFTACDVPTSVVDLGLMFQPNMELLFALKPDLIVISPAHLRLRSALERVAPTVTLGRYRSSEAPYSAARAETLQLARLLGCEARAEALLAQADTELDRARTGLAALPAVSAFSDVGGAKGRPFYMVNFLDEAHVRVFGPNSFYGELMTTLGLENAVDSGAFSTTGFDVLGSVPDATLLYMKPLAPSVANMMKTSPLWHAMPFKEEGRMIGLPRVPSDGCLLSAMLFARALVDTFEQANEQTGALKGYA